MNNKLHKTTLAVAFLIHIILISGSLWLTTFMGWYSSGDVYLSIFAIIHFIVVLIMTVLLCLYITKDRTNRLVQKGATIMVIGFLSAIIVGFGSGYLLFIYADRPAGLEGLGILFISAGLGILLWLISYTTGIYFYIKGFFKRNDRGDTIKELKDAPRKNKIKIIGLLVIALSIYLSFFIIIPLFRIMPSELLLVLGLAVSVFLAWYFLKK